ncbi:MAG TPA: TRAP transporter small permease [Spirochaetales bacterium]|nr:TRAP transporter small permease [Spirochaetales bacterium]
MKWDDYAEKSIIVVSNVIFTLMFLVVLLQIVGRYVMRNPFIWTEELARSLYVWLIFMGSSTLLKSYEHISIDFLPRKLKGKQEKAFKIFIDGIGLVFYVIVFFGGIRMMKNTHSVTLPCLPVIRMSYLYLAVVLSSIFSGVFLCGNIVKNLVVCLAKAEVN